VSKGDEIVEQGSDQLRGLAEKAAQRGGTVGKLAEPLAEDAAFLAKLKPSLIAARVRGGSPSSPRQPPPAPDPTRGRRGGPAGGGVDPRLVVAAAALAGIVVAKLLDWRGHAHPRG
jgi:hypothetical protein